MLSSIPLLIERAPSNPSLLEAQNFTLESFSKGMICGAGDGTLLFQHQRIAPSPEIALTRADLQDSAKLLKENLERVLSVAEENWTRAHPDDLHLLFGYGKQENAATLKEASKYAADDRSEREFLNFLLASFKGAYALGVAQAAVVFRG